MSFSYDSASIDALKAIVAEMRDTIGDTGNGEPGGGTQGTDYVFSDEQLIGFYGRGADVPTVRLVLSSDALADATELAVHPLSADLAADERVYFWHGSATQGTAKISTLAEAGDESVTVYALPSALSEGALGIAAPGNTRTQNHRVTMGCALALESWATQLAVSLGDGDTQGESIQGSKTAESLRAHAKVLRSRVAEGETVVSSTSAVSRSRNVSVVW